MNVLRAANEDAGEVVDPLLGLLDYGVERLWGSDFQANAQEWLSFNYEKYRNIKETAWGELFDIAQANPDFRRAVEVQFGRFLNALPTDDAETILEHNSDFTFFAKFMEMEDLTENQVDELLTEHMSAVVKTMRAAIEDTATASELLNHDKRVKLDHAEAKKIRKAQQDYESRLRSIGAAESALYILTFAAGRVDSQAAERMQTMTVAMLDLAKAINSYSGAVSEGENENQATANLSLNIAATTIRLISVIKSGPRKDPNEIISNQIAAIAENIDLLRQQMHARFDLVDTRLDRLFEVTVKGYREALEFYVDVDLSLSQIKSRIGQTQRSIYKLANQMATFEERMSLYLSDQYRREFDDALLVALLWRDDFSEDMPFESFTSHIKTIENWGIAYAKRPVVAGVVDIDLADDALIAERLGTGAERNVNLLALLAQDRLGVTSNIRTGDLANPLEWAIAASAYLQLASDWPEHYARTSVDGIDRLLEVGAQFEALLVGIRGMNVDSGYSLLQALVANHENRLKALESSLNAHEIRWLIDEKLQSIDLWSNEQKSASFIATDRFLTNCENFKEPIKIALPTDLAAQLPQPFVAAEQLGLGETEICVRQLSFQPTMILHPQAYLYGSKCQGAACKPYWIGTLQAKLEFGFKRPSGLEPLTLAIREHMDLWETVYRQTSELRLRDWYGRDGVMPLLESSLERVEAIDKVISTAKDPDGITKPRNWPCIDGNRSKCFQRQIRSPQDALVEVWLHHKSVSSQLWHSRLVSEVGTDSEIKQIDQDLAALDELVANELQLRRESFHASYILEQNAAGSPLAEASGQVSGSFLLMKTFFELAFPELIFGNDEVRGIFFGKDRLIGDPSPLARFDPRIRPSETIEAQLLVLSGLRQEIAGINGVFKIEPSNIIGPVARTLERLRLHRSKRCFNHPELCQ
jgi:predicted DNA-binding protein YlxM (UPF0122 family)